MQKELIENNPILKHSIEFSLAVINNCGLPDARHKYVISKQLLRSATSIGANAIEAQNAESKAGFIHKIKIAAKKADETQHWLTLYSYSAQYPDCDALFTKLETVQKNLNAISGTAKRKRYPVTFRFPYFLTVPALLLSAN